MHLTVSNAVEAHCYALQCTTVLYAADEGLRGQNILQSVELMLLRM